MLLLLQLYWVSEDPYLSWVLQAMHIHNRDWEDHILRPACANSSRDPLSKIIRAEQNQKKFFMKQSKTPH
jgi:hypothetical protein